MKTMKWINTLAFATMVTINILADLLPLGGKTTGQISASYPSLFTPAGMTFSIWGVIYLLMGMFILFQWGLFGPADAGSRIVTQIGPLFAVSCALNIAWLLCWHSDAIGWSLLCICALLVTLIMIQPRIKPGSAGILQRAAVNAGFDIYYGWIIAAGIANISIWLVKTGWNRFGLSEVFWTTAVILTGAAVGVCVVLIGRNRLAGLALTWAYVGILTKHLSGSGHDGKYPVIIAAVILSIAAILVSIGPASLCTSLRTREEFQ